MIQKILMQDYFLEMRRRGTIMPFLAQNSAINVKYTIGEYENLLFCSYLRGVSGNTRAIEIVNAGNVTANLENYRLERDTLGNGTFEYGINLSGELLPGNTFLIVNETIPDTELKNKADLITSNLFMLFVYADTIRLRKNGVTIDLFTEEASNSFTPIFLKRKPTILMPNLGPTYARTNDEWENYSDYSVAKFKNHKLFWPVETEAKEYDGEFLRLIKHLSSDPFYFNLNKQLGWIVDKTSPLNTVSLLKSIFYTEANIYSSSNIPIVDDSYVAYKHEKDTSKHYIEFTLTNTNNGIGVNSLNNTPSKAFFLPIMKKVCYQISFYIKTTSLNTKIEFGVDAYNKNFELVDLSEANTNQYLIEDEGDFLVDDEGDVLLGDSGVSTNIFFEDFSLNKINTWYKISAIIYASSFNFIPDFYNKLTIGTGVNLQFNSDCSFFVPFVYVKNSSGSEKASIWNMVIEPVFSKDNGIFAQPRDTLNILCLNNNKKNSQIEIEDLTSNLLIPFGVSSNPILIQ